MKIIKKIKEMFGIMSDADKERVELKRVSEVFGTLERMTRCGLVAWMERDRRLFIAEPLAVVQMRSKETWDAFMQNVLMWTLYKRQSEAWEKAFTMAESKAIKEARKKKAILRKDEIERIRRAAREAVVGPDGEASGTVAVKVPKVEGFEVFIVRDESPYPASPRGGDKDADAGSEVIAVGRYDAETERTDMVMWEDIASQIKKE